MWLTLLPLLKQIWMPLALICAVLVAALGVRYWGYTEYKRGRAEVKVELKACQENFTSEVEKWNGIVEKQQKDLEVLASKKNEVITNTKIVYKEVVKKLDENKKDTSNEIKANIRPNDIVVVPNAFIGVYNHAVEGSRIATGTGDSQGKEFSRYSQGTIGTSSIFDAITFTEVVKGNVDKYNELANRCSKLQDIVEKMEQQ